MSTHNPYLKFGVALAHAAAGKPLPSDADPIEVRAALEQAEIDSRWAAVRAYEQACVDSLALATEHCKAAMVAQDRAIASLRAALEETNQTHIL